MTQNRDIRIPDQSIRPVSLLEKRLHYVRTHSRMSVAVMS